MKLGRYEVVRELGKGAMGIVYLAKDPLIGRLVALKTIRPVAHADDDETKEFQQRFIREAQAAGILNHPSIVTVHDIGQDDTTGVSFIAMEYVEGNNLKEVLSQGRPLTFDQVGDIIAQVADALDFAHSKGIVHRDVKPANVILIDGTRAKITDFGIAKIASGGANLTTTGQFLGTPNYMAPEQVKGTPVDGRSDIFSLGICLYECLTRRKPFGGDSLTSISYKIVHEPFPPMLEINPTIPDGYEEVVAQCLAKDPAKRYQRGKDLAAALRAVLRGERPTKPVDPMLSEATMITRDRDRLPTVEIPFPDANAPPAAVDASPSPADTRAAKAMAGVSAAAAQAGVSTKPSAKRLPKPGTVVRKTLDGVRALPIWRTRLHPALFLGLVIAALLVLLGVVITLHNKQVPVPTVDRHTELLRARERQLRLEGNQALAKGRVNDAYTKYGELGRLAPHSPFVAALLEKLSQIRQQEESGKQQRELAQQKFDQGMALYNEKKYAEAIPPLMESFHLNPNSDATAQYLKLAQQEDERERQNKSRAKAAQQNRIAQNNNTSTRGPAPITTIPTATRDSTAHQVTPPVVQPTTPASLTIVMNSKVTDGTITVKVGSEVIAKEDVYEKSFFRRRPRQVNVTKAFTPKNADVEVWIQIDSLIVDHQVLRAQNFPPGTNRKLTINFDPQSKKLDLQVN